MRKHEFATALVEEKTAIAVIAIICEDVLGASLSDRGWNLRFSRCEFDVNASPTQEHLSGDRPQGPFSERILLRQRQVNQLSIRARPLDVDLRHAAALDIG